jgi:4-amino-4-deoxy-L-arabinose transferase-like glycosyltransferase
MPTQRKRRQPSKPDRPRKRSKLPAAVSKPVSADAGTEITYQREGPAESETIRLGVSIQPGTRVRLTVEASEVGEWPRVIFQHTVGELRPADLPPSPLPVSAPTPAKPSPAPASWRDGWQERRRRLAIWWLRTSANMRTGPVSPAVEIALFACSVLVYLAVRLYRISDFPIYFFTDEAVQTVLAADFVRDGYRDFLGNYWPTYFQNVYRFNLSFSVYAQLIPYLLFGKSVFVTRATAAILTLPGAIAIGLALRDFFRLRFWWAGILVLSMVPAWFLHSRTAFETALMTSFFACSLYFYLRYRLRSPVSLYLALVFGAMAFYTYSPGQIIVPATALLLLALDFPYHRQHGKVVLRGLLLLVLLALPYLRFYLLMPEAQGQILRILDSPWSQPTPLADKVMYSLQAYARGISPAYWFWPNDHDLARHTMNGHGHMMRWMFPFALIGLIQAVRGWRHPAHRALLACLLAIPLAGAVAGAGITRLLSFVIPATMLVVIGLDLPVNLVLRRFPRSATGLALATFLVLTSLNLLLLRDSLVNGPLWNRIYGMEMQYGASQVFAEVQEILRENPKQQVLVSPTWGNGIDIVRRFFLPDSVPVEVGNADRFLSDMGDLTAGLLFVLTPEEYRALLQDPKIANLRVERTLPYPDGTTGFYFVRMTYSPAAEALFAQEREERSRPVTETIDLDGEQVQVTHPIFDSGNLGHVFDKDPYTLARGMEANPFLLDIVFPTPRTLTGLLLTTGSMDIGLQAELFSDSQSGPVVVKQEFVDLPPDPTVHLAFPPELGPVTRLRLLISQLYVAGPSKVHIRELALEQP